MEPNEEQMKTGDMQGMGQMQDEGEMPEMHDEMKEEQMLQHILDLIDQLDARLTALEQKQ